MLLILSYPIVLHVCGASGTGKVNSLVSHQPNDTTHLACHPFDANVICWCCLAPGANSARASPLLSYERGIGFLHSEREPLDVVGRVDDIGKLVSREFGAKLIC